MNEKINETKVKFCWECGKRLYQWKISVKKLIDGHERTLHKNCAKNLELGIEGWREEDEH